MTKSSSNSSTKSGNTRQISPAVHWCFTYNNYDETSIKDLLDKLSSSKYVFQEEIGEQGTPHLQGYVAFNKKVRAKQYVGIDKIHWEKKKGTIKDCIRYCSKSETRKENGRLWIKGLEIEKEIKTITPRGWQKEVIEIISQEPDDRSIHVFYEKDGNVGKSQLAKYMCVHHNGLVLMGKGSDMKYGIAEYMDTHMNYPSLIIIDIPRSHSEFVSWAGIEEIKNACFFSPKYKGKMIIGNCPHIIIFCNKKPELNNLSEDRWKLHHIKVE